MANPREEEVRPPSPRSPTSILLEGNLRVATGGMVPDGIAVRHLPVSHSGNDVSDGNLTENGLEYNNSKQNGEKDYIANGGTETKATTLFPTLSLDDCRKSIVTIINEYFITGDLDTVTCELRDLDIEEHYPYFLKKLVSIAMDWHDKEKEMASVLLSSLYTVLLSSSHIKQGFMNLLESTEDLSVDIPDTVNILALFIARAVVDEILPPVFITRARESLSNCPKGIEVLKIAEKSYLSAPHHAELIERKWGGSTCTNVEMVKGKIVDLLREYTESGDLKEAFRCIRELGLPFFHHEVVKRALTLAMENPASETLILDLFKSSIEECLITSDQMTKGFSRFSESLDDLTLDIPSAKPLFEKISNKAISEGWIEPSFRDQSSPNGTKINSSNRKFKANRFKEECVNIIQEYFLSDDIPELLRSLVELSAPRYNPIFVKKLVTLAMDRKNREKEMASVLLSSLSMELFTNEDIINGFVMLLESAEDTALDILDASNELALFLARAVIDEVLAPLNLDEIYSRLGPDSTGRETVQLARVLVSARHAGERLLRCWGGGTGWAVEDAKDKIWKLLEEYAAGGDLGEACRCIRDLGMPFFNHEVVKKALVLAMERKSDTGVLVLLQECFGEGLITINQMTKGFARVRDGLEDLSLDIPNASEKFQGYVEHAVKHGWLLPAF